MSDVIELLPKEQIILALLEQKFSDEAIARCKYLSGKGYRLAVDNFKYPGDFYKILMLPTPKWTYWNRMRGKPG